MNETNGGQKEKEEVKTRKRDGRSMVQEASHHNEPEKMLKDCTEAAKEELSRKKLELGTQKKKVWEKFKKMKRRSKRRKTRKTMI